MVIENIGRPCSQRLFGVVHDCELEDEALSRFLEIAA